ncbi:endolytic transglycosylase MltG [Litoribacter ruber]|uniref:Endolytic murein transglycosylase n=1 Tax=Litoribacter ruber TaxID=702568 RepID=A0AAP2CFV0_9BACT|nr:MULTISPECIES: endolytic transglycosylase MltG [Litoribacter]MBS9523843.1 endolytic transglycosylase MltG [Litoribacter alkaliphilus]MBT0811562.1 endolytic transglycosylase MltG [Litoribacter ruber]
MIPDKKTKRYLIAVIAVTVLMTSMTFYFYQAFFSPNALTDKEEPALLKIPRGATFKTVSDSLTKNEIIHDIVTFSFVAKVRGYQDDVKPGLYEIRPKMSNKDLVALLSSGRQTPVRLTFNNIRTKEDLAEKVTRNLEMDQAEFKSLLTDSTYYSKFDLKEETVMSIFIPNTYEVYWNVTPEGLFDRMHKEYEKFWNEERTAKLTQLNLDRKEVSTLASIVQAETQMSDERPRVAGVYLNRLRMNMPLQADPTLVFALQDFSIKRVLNVHKEIDSPYNTYKYTGLPPGPINLPDISSIDAVLAAEDHKYIYFCAKDDFSGYHAFATNYNEHLQNARRYQQALNRAKIY